jgi:hypothetical protein
MGRTRSQVLGAHVHPRKRAPETRPNLITTLSRSPGNLALHLRPPRHPSQQTHAPAIPFGSLPTAANSVPLPSPPPPTPATPTHTPKGGSYNPHMKTSPHDTRSPDITPTRSEPKGYTCIPKTRPQANKARNTEPRRPQTHPLHTKQ